MWTEWKPTKFLSSWSPSASVSSFFGNNNTLSTTGGWQVADRLTRVLDEVNKSANMLVNSAGDETKFKVTWASNRGTNEVDFSNNSFVLSPNIMLEGKGKMLEGDRYFEALDALNGRVIIGAQIRKNVGLDEYEKFKDCTDAEVKRTFQTLQESKAAEVIHEEWPGFRPYLAAHSKASHATKRKVSAHLPTNDTKNEADKIVLVANHNLLNPDDKIQLDNDRLNQLIEEFNSRLGDNFDSVKDAVDWLKNELVDVPPPPSGGESPSSEDDGSEPEEQEEQNKDQEDGDDEQEQEENGSDGSSDSGRKPLPMPFDDQLLSSEVKSKVDVASEESDHSICEVENAQVFVWDKKLLSLSMQRNGYYGDMDSSSKANYKNIVSRNRKSIKEIEKVFLFEDTTPTIKSHGLAAGDLDDNALYKVRMNDFERIYEVKDIPNQSNHVVGLLLDQSGSMGGYKIDAAKEVLICLLEGLKTYKTIKTVVMGHTAQYGRYYMSPADRKAYKLPPNPVDIIPYITPEGGDNRHLLANANALANNLDGVAISHLASVLQTVKEVDNRILFVISDGQPSGDAYNGADALSHVRKSVEDARKKGIRVFGIGIADAYSIRVGDQMYGANNHVILKDVESSLRLLVRKLKQFLVGC